MNSLNLVIVRNLSFKCVEETKMRWKCGENKVEDEVWVKRKIERKKKDRCFYLLKIREHFFVVWNGDACFSTIDVGSHRWCGVHYFQYVYSVQLIKK